METIYFITVVVGFVVVLVTMLVISYLEKRDNAKKDISIAKLLRLTDPGAVIAIEQVPVVEEKEIESDLVDISDMPSLHIDKEE